MYRFKVFDEPYQDVEAKREMLTLLANDEQYKKWGPNGDNESGVGVWQGELHDFYTPTACYFGLYFNETLVACARAIIHPDHPKQAKKVQVNSLGYEHLPIEAMCYMSFREALEWESDNLLAGLNSPSYGLSFIELNRCAVHRDHQGQGAIYFLMARMLDSLKSYDCHLFVTSSDKSIAEILARGSFCEGPVFKYNPNQPKEDFCTLFYLDRERIMQSVSHYNQWYTQKLYGNLIKKMGALSKLSPRNPVPPPKLSQTTFEIKNG